MTGGPHRTIANMSQSGEQMLVKIAIDNGNYISSLTVNFLNIERLRSLFGIARRMLDKVRNEALKTELLKEDEKSIWAAIGKLNGDQIKGGQVERGLLAFHCFEIPSYHIIPRQLSLRG